MALTNFAALDVDQKKVWSRDVWHQAREKMFTSRYMGKGQNSMIQRVTELTKSERGVEAVVTLVPDIQEDGVVGDNTLTGNEAAMKAHQDKITIDQLRNGVRNTGKLTDQKTVINFREQAKDQLSFWLADRCDQLAFLSLAGITYDTKNDGSARGGNLINLAFAADVSAPSTDRYLQVSGTELVPGDTATLTAADTLGYKHIVQLQALAKTRYVRGIRGKGGSEVYHLFLHPMAMAKLKVDQDFLDNARHAGVRGDGNTVWAGGDSYHVDGVIVTEFRHVPTTLGLSATVDPDGAGPLIGSKWGATGEVDGCAALLCGAQALAFIDLDAGDWDERDHFDYGNSVGIAYGKIFGMKKCGFKDAKNSTDVNVKEDYGVIRINVAL